MNVAKRFVGVLDHRNKVIAVLFFLKLDRERAPIGVFHIVFIGSRWKRSHRAQKNWRIGSLLLNPVFVSTFEPPPAHKANRTRPTIRRFNAKKRVWLNWAWNVWRAVFGPRRFLDRLPSR